MTKQIKKHRVKSKEKITIKRFICLSNPEYFSSSVIITVSGVIINNIRLVDRHTRYHSQLITVTFSFVLLKAILI